jgi:hypothetical protein
MKVTAISLIYFCNGNKYEDSELVNKTEYS